ncbi:MAG: universal stress protein [Candidatus Marinimicrobia bacterium]|jgi:nucleotide-binding universal stress UspA family protein|nr:universal stress protein [Candidatus Neomarinimicrobiota bacterium]MBT4149091.1 universal stress protein [Candidatus Neomarinimicrobiota bacterium]MBT5097247.1 universal stress protein [Candidatus Neomarinimicrobiota bacterium]
MNYKNIMVGLCGRGDESAVILEAIKIANGGHITFIHINDPHAGEMSMMMDALDKKITESDVLSWISKVDKSIVENCSILIKSDNSIPKAIYKASEGKDLVVLGHRKQSFFKENFFDSIDEGIVNKVLCPVLVIPK